MQTVSFGQEQPLENNYSVHHSSAKMAALVNCFGLLCWPRMLRMAVLFTGLSIRAGIYHSVNLLPRMRLVLEIHCRL